jgi:serine/threonine-protein kinase HipA
MTMTGHVESEIRDSAPSYLELAEFIQYYGVNPKADLEQLWRRIVFNICISNTDDHLRNHGFLLMDEGWRLSPAYDLNPTVNKSGLALNIDLHNNDLDFDLARSVGGYFDLNHRQMDKITGEVQDSVGEWKQIATSLGISTGQIRLMESAFLK